jgi:HK97 family phage major capsid protein
MTLTLPGLIRDMNSKLAQMTGETQTIDDELQLIAQRARAERSRDPYLAADQPRHAALSARKMALEIAHRGLRDKVTELEREQREDERLDQAARTVGPGGATLRDGSPQIVRAYDQVFRVGRSERTYDQASAQQGISFFRDAFGAQLMGDPGAQERMQHHFREAEVDGFTSRATTTGSFAGLVVPQYLVDQAALVARAGRPVANSIMRMPLPEQGMSLLVPRGTTGASAAVQTAENTAVSNTDEVWGNLSVPVVTISGQQDVSRQSLERGTPGLDSLIYMDLAAAYATALDQQVLFGSGSGGQMLGIFNTAGINSATAFGAIVTAGNYQTKVAGQNQAVQTSRYLAPSAIFMHPRRWAWMMSLTDSSGRPLVTPNVQGPNNAAAVLKDAFEYGNVVGSFQGLPVITDANIQTTVGTNSEDITYVVRAEDLILWEDGDGMPKQLRFEQTTGGSLTTKLVAYGYAAFTAGRYPSAVGYVGGKDATAGQGLVAPTF